MNRAQRRAQKNQPRKYTDAEVERIVRDTVTEIARNNLRITVAGCALVAHREFGFGKQRLCRLIQVINDLAFDTFNVNELQEQLKKEAGVDLTFFEDAVTTGLEV